MRKIAKPVTEAQPSSKPRQLQWHDKTGGAHFDSILRAVSNLCEVPYAYIILVDKPHEMLVSAIGLEEANPPSEIAMFRRAIETTNELCEVQDTLTDERIIASGWVPAATSVRFFASQSLINSSGEQLGLLCIFDYEARSLNKQQKETIRHLGKVIQELLGQYSANSKGNATERELLKAQLFLESAPDATFITDDVGKLVLANREAEFLFGYTVNELLTMPIEALMPSRYRTQHLQHRQDYAIQPAVREMGQGMNIIALTKKGKEIPVDIRLSPISYDGKQFFSASVRDVSAHVRTENELQDARHKAERATAQKSRFLAAASHDLRQPLQAISLYLSVFGRTSDEDKRKEISRKMQLSIDNINGMLGTLLDISKLDSGSIQPDKANTHLQSIFDKVMAASTQQAADKGLVLTCTAKDEVVFTDPVLLERVIENFITNAIRYTDHGEVILHTEKIAQQLAICVSDTGIGIDSEQFDQVFEEYYQLDNPVRNRNKGLGLGLSIVKHISRLLDHTIDVQSEIGKGSTFSITVPLANGAQTDDAQESTFSLGNSSITSKPLVLLVDDDPSVLDSTTMLLELAGTEVAIAHDSDEALALLDSGKTPSLIITDYWLPGMNGLELLTAARKKLVMDIPAILITGDTTSPELMKPVDTDVKILHKPVDADQLLKLVNDYLPIS